MQKNEKLTNILVEKLVFSGKGLAHTEDGKAIMIAGGVIPGQRVNLRVLKSRKGHIEAQVLDVLEKSSIEIDLPEHFQVYGGCKWLPIAYEEQLSIKADQVKDCFRPITTLVEGAKWHPIVPSPQIYGYRNKLEFSFGKYISAKEGVHEEFRFGFHKQGEFDRIVDCEYCVLASDSVNTIFKKVDELSRASGMPTYDPKTQVGVWRHLVLRESLATGDVMVIFSINTNDTAYNKDLFDGVWKIIAQMDQVSTVVLLKNTGKADIVTGDAEVLYGSGTITEKIFDMEFEIRPKSFFQTNTLGAEKLYDTVRSLIKNKNGTLLDLYAGTGTIGLMLSGEFAKVISVEIVPDASKDAGYNAERNGVTNFTTVNAPVEKFLAEYLAADETADTLVIDPPRDGMHPSAPENILKFKANEIVYVSCNPATLARDLQLLLATGTYKITDIVPVDMFPHTHHIETVVRLQKI